MIWTEWLAAVLASIVGAVVVALFGWFYGLRKLHNRVETVERRQARSDRLVRAILRNMPDEQAGIVLKAAMEDPSFVD